MASLWCLYCRVFKHVNANLRSIRKSIGIRKEIDPASSAGSDKKGHKDNKNGLLGIVNKFCTHFGTKSKILNCGGFDSDCTVVTLHRTANFRIKHHKSVIASYIAYINTPIPFFSEKHNKQTGFWGQNSHILIPPKISIFEISIFFETKKSAYLVS